MPKKSKIISAIPKKLHLLWHLDQILVIILLLIFFFFYPGQNIYTLSPDLSRPQVKRLPIELPPPAPYPVNFTGLTPTGEVTGQGVVVLDADSGVFLYKRNENMQFLPASTTKILTALVALDQYSLDEVLTVRQVVNSGQTMKLLPGERMSVENLLFGTLVASGNDAAWTLAENYPGGVEKFVEAMNVKAKSIHLASSHFTNPVGYDDPDHKMTPLDLSRLASVALTNKIISKIVAIPQITVSDVTHTYYHPLQNVNQLLGKIPGVAGIKTGWTQEAGENLVTLVERNGHRVIIVVLKSQDRFADTSKLIDWVFNNYQWQTFSPVD